MTIGVSAVLLAPWGVAGVGVEAGGWKGFSAGSEA